MLRQKQVRGLWLLSKPRVYGFGCRVKKTSRLVKWPTTFVRLFGVHAIVFCVTGKLAP